MAKDRAGKSFQAMTSDTAQNSELEFNDASKASTSASRAKAKKQPKNFVLPPNWYHEAVGALIDTELPPVLGTLTSETAWRYVYACVLWENYIEGKPYLHLNDRLSQKAGRELAERGRTFLEHHLGTRRIPDVSGVIDGIVKRYRAERESQGITGNFQRNNVTGGSFEATLQELIHRLCGVRPLRGPKLRDLRGFELAPVGYHSSPDLALFTPSDFRVLVSTKWTLRKERIGTYLHEAYYYKLRRSDLQVAFVISEFNLNIIEWLVNDPLVDRVYHVHLPMLLSVHEPFRSSPKDTKIPLERLLARRRDPQVHAYGRWLAISDKLFDLAQLFKDIDRLSTEPTVEDPQPAVSEDDDGQ